MTISLNDITEIAHLKTSGSAVIICSAGGIPGTCLYFRSPMERDKFKLPFTRPNWLTNPPAFVMRSISRF